MTTVLLSEPIHAEGRRILAEIADVRVAAGTDEDALARELAAADALVLRARGRVGPATFANAARLKVIARYGAGVDNVDLAAAREHGVVVVNAPGANSRSVAEHAVACLLALARRLPEHDRAVRSGDWAARDRGGTRELHGMTLGVVGLGHVGLTVAQMCSLGLGMQVLYADPGVPAPPPGLAARRTSLDRLVATADAVTLHLPLTAATAGLLDAARIALMKPTAYLVNTSRGGLIDEHALAAALRGGRLAGAALDVFGSEPPCPSHPLLDCPGTLLTPHAAALTEDADRRVAVTVARDVAAVLAGKPPKHRVEGVMP
jgi:D-3-phosphoglycerate dehydrogenase